MSHLIAFLLTPFIIIIIGQTWWDLLRPLPLNPIPRPRLHVIQPDPESSVRLHSANIVMADGTPVTIIQTPNLFGR